MKNKPIGVLDSGVGALTVAKEVQKKLPGENIIYFGDNGNCPVGNRPKEEILEITHNMLQFMEEQGVKIVAVACNTISTLIDDYRDSYSFPIVSIIEPISEKVVQDGLDNIGVIATEFTIKMKTYDRLIQKENPSIRVHGKGSKTLATLVDTGQFEGDAIDKEVKEQVDYLVDNHEVEHIILGCTHFPIVLDSFHKANSSINYIDPAAAQVEELKKILEEKDALNPEGQGTLDIYTSGTRGIFDTLTQRLQVKNFTVHEVQRTPLKKELG